MSILPVVTLSLVMYTIYMVYVLKTTTEYKLKGSIVCLYALTIILFFNHAICYIVTFYVSLLLVALKSII